MGEEILAIRDTEEALAQREAVASWLSRMVGFDVRTDFRFHGLQAALETQESMPPGWGFIAVVGVASTAEGIFREWLLTPWWDRNHHGKKFSLGLICRVTGKLARRWTDDPDVGSLAKWAEVEFGDSRPLRNPAWPAALQELLDLRNPVAHNLEAATAEAGHRCLELALREPGLIPGLLRARLLGRH